MFYYFDNAKTALSKQDLDKAVNCIIECATTFTNSEVRNGIFIIDDVKKSVSKVTIDGLYYDTFMETICDVDYVDAREYAAVIANTIEQNIKLRTIYGCLEVVVENYNAINQEQYIRSYNKRLYYVAKTDLMDDWAVFDCNITDRCKHRFIFTSRQAADKWLQSVKYLLNQINF